MIHIFVDIILPSALRRENDEVPVKRPVYGKKKPKKELKQDEKGFFFFATLC